MCVVSAITDNWNNDFGKRWPGVDGAGIGGYSYSPITRAEFEALKREVESLKALLLQAKKFDEDTGQKDCEKDEKVALLKKIAEAVGVDLTEVFK